MFVGLDLLKDQDTVRPGAALIHASSRSVNCILALLDVGEDLLWTRDYHFVLINNLVIHDLEARRLGLIGLEQIVEAFVVYLEVGHRQLESSTLFINGLIHVGEDVPDSSWNDTVALLNAFLNLSASFDDFNHFLRAEHGECLASATHPIREDCSIVALGELLYSGFCCYLVHFILIGLDQNLIEVISH